MIVLPTLVVSPIDNYASNTTPIDNTITFSSLVLQLASYVPKMVIDYYLNNFASKKETETPSTSSSRTTQTAIMFVDISGI